MTKRRSESDLVLNSAWAQPPFLTSAPYLYSCSDSFSFCYPSLHCNPFRLSFPYNALPTSHVETSSAPCRAPFVVWETSNDLEYYTMTMIDVLVDNSSMIIEHWV